MLVETREEFEAHLQIIRESSILSLDTETNIAPRWDRYLVGFSYYAMDESGNDYTAYFPFRHNHNRSLFLNGENLPYEWLSELRDALLSNLDNKQLIFHNAKFDIPVFIKEGIDLSQAFYWDTMLMSHMVNENVFSHGLKDLARSFWGPETNSEADFIKKLLKNLQGKWETCPPGIMAEYCCKDSKLTYMLYKRFLPEMQEQELIELWNESLDFNKALMNTEETGIRIKPDVAKGFHTSAQKELAELLIELGYDPMKPAELAHRLYAKPEDGGLGFIPHAFSKRKSKEFVQGLPVMDEMALSRLDHPEVQKVLRVRSLVKSDSTWFKGFLDRMSPAGRLHTEYKQHGTVTGRLSSVEPNLQQLPRDKDKSPVKLILNATDGYELHEFDYSQIELRLGSLYANATEFLEAFRNDSDLHQMTAEAVGAYNNPALNPENARFVGKQVNFLTINGGGAQVLRKTLWKEGRLDVPLGTCEIILDNYHKANPGFRDVANRAAQAMIQNGYVKLWNGRRRHLLWQSEAHKAFNSLIQGGAAMIVQRSFIMLNQQGYRTVGQVHDSVWVEIPIDEVEVQVPKIQEIMSSWVEEYFELPFPVDAKLLATAS